VPEHGVRLVQIRDALLDHFVGLARGIRELGAYRLIVRQELVQRGIQVRMVTGRLPIARKIPAKSSRCSGSSLAKAARRSVSVSATIISRMGPILPSPKNMCSVRQRPIPSAPNATAASA